MVDDGLRQCKAIKCKVPHTVSPDLIHWDISMSTLQSMQAAFDLMLGLLLGVARSTAKPLMTQLIENSYMIILIIPSTSARPSCNF